MPPRTADSGSHNQSVETLRKLVTVALSTEVSTPVSFEIGPIPEALNEVALHHRVESLLVDHAAELGLEEATLALFMEQARAQHMAGLLLVKSTFAVGELFTRHSFDFLIFKGVPLSVLSGRKPSSRGAGDIDVLIHPRDVPRAHAVLMSEGFRPKIAFAPQDGRAWNFWSFRERELSYRKDGIFIDLHWRVPKNAHHFPDTKAVLARKSEISIGKGSLKTLSPGDSLAACAIHIYLDYCQNLRLFTDLVFLSRLPGNRLPEDLPLPGRQLVSDVLEFARRLLHESVIPQVPGTLDPIERNVQFLQRMWSGNSGLNLLQAGSTSRAGEAVGRFGHWMRYGGSLREILRFASWAFFGFPEAKGHKVTTSFWEALTFRTLQVVSGNLPYLKERRKNQ